MKAYALEPAELASEARAREEYGADAVTIMDSAGYMMPDDAARYVEVVAGEVSIPVGFNGHNNLGLSVANGLAAWRAWLQMAATPRPVHRQHHSEVSRGQATLPALRPFDQPQARLGGIQPQELQLAGIADPVQVQVQGHPAAGQRVVLDQGVGRAANGAGHAQRTQQRPGKRGFSGAEVAMQVGHGMWWQGAGEARAKRIRGVRVFKEYIVHAPIVASDWPAGATMA